MCVCVRARACVVVFCLFVFCFVAVVFVLLFFVLFFVVVVFVCCCFFGGYTAVSEWVPVFSVFSWLLNNNNGNS